MTDNGERMLDGRYKLRREIHKTRSCTVYQAQHRYTRRTVALKWLHRSLAQSETERAILMGEARLLSEIRHACVPDVYDAGVVDDDGVGRPYVVMEMVEGRSLAGLLAARQRLEIPTALALAQALASTLRAVHKSGVVHLDVSPRNILLPTARADRQLETRGAPIKLLDFTRAVCALLDDDSVRTDGDEAYHAPEQLNGEATDERADVFAVGSVIYECIAGVPPYQGQGASRYAVPARPLSEFNDDAYDALDEALRGAFAVDREERYRDMDALLAALARATRDKSEPAPLPESLSAAPPPPDHATRRRHVRAAYLTPVRVVREDRSTIDCSSEDLSEGGMLLLGPQLDSDEEQVQVRFALPISGRVVTLSATTRWRHQARDGHGATGLEFADIDDATRTEIAQYVEYFAGS